MKRRLNRFVSILLTLIMAVGLVPFMSVPAQAKADIPVVMSTANGDTVNWSSKVGSNDGYWEITAENSNYAVCICSGVTDHEAGTYEWSDLESTVCHITVDADETSYNFTDGSCTVTVNGEVVNVSGVFEAEDGNHYAVDITYGTSVSFTKVTDESQITAENIGTCTAYEAKAWALANWNVVHNDDFTSSLVFYTSDGELTVVLVFTDTDEEYFSEYFDEYFIYQGGFQISDFQERFGIGQTVCICTAAAASSKFVVTFSTDQPRVGLAVDTTATFACDSQGDGRLDHFIKIILGGNPTDSGVSANVAPTVTGGNGAVVAGLDNGYQYLTINERFDGNVTVSGKYYMGIEETDYSFTIACSDYVPVESVSLSPDTAQEINVDGTVAITPTVSPDGAYESVVEVTVGGTDSGAVALYFDADCNYPIQPIIPSGMPFYVKGVSAGTATVTITSPEDENITASIDITVNAPAATASFVKVTDASQIAADNIGECTFDEAKAWVYDNWDSVTNGVDPSNIIDIVYIVNGSARVIYFSTGDYADKDEFKDQIHSDSNAGLVAIKGYYNSGDDVVYVCSKADAPGAYADLKNTTTVITFDEKQWYLIDYDSTTVTLLSKECVGASKFDENGTSNIYSGSTIENYVNNYYSNNISANAKTVVNGNGMFLLTTDQANAIKTANINILKCSQVNGTSTNAWWLSTGSDQPAQAGVFFDSHNLITNSLVEYLLGVRPALKLDLSKVEFDSSTNTFEVPAAPVTEWHIGDTINLGGKYYINDDQGAPSSCGFDRDVIVSEPVYETMYNQWIFENVIASNASEAFALYISLPAGKTEADVPAGFKVKSGDGTQASPYQFELVYAAAASSKFVVTFSTDQPRVGLAVDTTATFACDSQGNGRLDHFIKIILGGNPTASGLSASIAPTVTGGNGAVVAGLDNGNQYLTINERFDGNVTVSGKYYMGIEETDYSFTIACSDYVAVESVSLSPDTAQEINVDGTVAITPTVSPDGAYESVVEVTVGGTDSGAVALYSDADCNYSIQPIIPSGMPFYVKGVSAGTATVTITSPEDENITASIDITVNAAAASFVKVTDASQIAVVNIGTCTAEDAKAWALANWDDLLEDSFFAEIAFYSNTGELYYVQVYNGLDEEYFSQYFDNLIATCSISDLQDCFADGDSVFICTPAAAPAVKYLDENGEEKTTLDYILINGTNYESFDFEGVTVGSLAEGNGFNAGDLTWIIIDGNVTFTNVINVSGTANVILKDGATLTASKGVYVPEGSTLNIYAQSTGDDMGVVVATGSSGCAGIGSGSNYGDACGTIVINGGNITATGGTYASGIGGSKGGTITVNGGYVEANGSYAPGIGVPADGVVGGTFTFNGGTVIANGGDEWSAGIGGYNECMGTGTIVIGDGLGLEVSADNSTWTDTTNDTTARARYMKVGVIEYPLWVGGVQVTSANAMDTTAHPTWGYSAYTHTLTLNGYTNSGTARADIQSGVNNAAIYYNDNMSNPNPLTIRLAEGTTNSLTMTGDRVYGIYVFGSALTITGNGTLNVQSEDMAINDAWGVAITGGTVYAASSGYYGINSVTIGSDISSVTVTGELGAVYGGSNEDQALINAVAGTGWTDTAGTTGEADIAISTTGQNVSSYKKVQFPAVEHVLPSGLWVGGTEVTSTVTSGDGWSYNASTNTLTLTDYYYDGDGFAYTNKNSAGIYYKGESPLNIVVEKTQYYSYIGGYENNFVGIYAEGGVVLTGEGRLNIYGNSGGIIGDVTVDGCELEVTCGEVDGKGSTAVTSLTVNSGKVTVDGGTVSGNGVVGGYAVETLTVNGGIVYANGGDGYNSYEPTTQSAVKTLTVSGGVLYAKGGVSNWNSDLVPAVVTTADGGSITVGKDVKVYGADIRSSERHDMPNTLIEEEGGDFDRFFYMIFEGPSVSVTVPYKDHEWTDGALVTTDKEMTCNTMTFGVGTSWSGNYYVDHNVTFGTIDNPVNITLTGNTNIILSDTATLYVYGTIDCGDYTLNIYGNEMGDGGYSRVAFHSGAFTVNNTSEKALALKASKMNIHGGTVEVNGTGDYDDTMFVVEADGFSVYAGSFRAYVNGEKGLSALASASTNVYGGRFNVSGGQSSGENVKGGTGFKGSLCVYGGYVNAYGGDAYGNGAYGGNGITGNVEVYGGQVSTSGGYSSAADGGIAMFGGLCVYGGTFDADGGYANVAQKNNTAICAIVTLGEGVGYFEGKTLFAEGPEEGMESGDANYAQIKGGAKYVYVDATTGAVTTAYTYEASNRIDGWLWSNWYIVEKDTTINDAVNFETNEVNIIIADGVTLTFANGLNVPEGKTLKIYAQSMDEATMGTLIATGANGSAGIGATSTNAGGNVYIYSGNVEATGDTGAAGIDGIVYIYGGKVTATGGEGSVGINGDLTLGEGIMLYGDDDVNPPTTVIEEESGNYHRTRYMIAAMEAEEEPSVQTVTVTAHSLSKIYGFEDPEFTYTVEGLPAGVALTGSLTRTEGEDVGTYAITIGTLSAGDKYTLIFKCGALEITARNVDVKADAASKTYGDADPELTYTVEGLVGNDALTGALARTEGETAGTYEITQGTLSAGNNYVINFTGSTLTIGKKTVTVKADAVTKTYGDEDPELTYTIEGLVGTDALTGTLERAEGENAGTYRITQGTLEAGGNYEISFTGSALTIEKKAVTVKADAKTKTYGDEDPELTYTVEGLVGTDTLTGSLERVSGEDAGTYDITIGTLSAGDNYEINFTGSTLTINSAEIKTVKVSANAVTKTYGEKDPELTYTAEGLAEGDTLTGTLERAEGENVGIYAITLGTLTAGDKYTIEFTGSTLTIEKKTVKVTANDVTKTYGENDPELTYTVEGLVGNDALTGSLERVSGEDAGTYDITIGTLSAGDNYVISFTGATLTINTTEIKTVKVTANAVTKTYGEKDPELTYTAEGLAEGDTLTGTLERAEGEDAGIYAITLGTLTAGDNYTIEFTGSTLTIEKKTVTVTADAKTKTDGENDPELTYTVEGLVGNDALTGSLERAAGEDAGTYDITIGTLSAGDNYEINFIGSTLTINASEIKTVKVTANAVAKTYGDKDPELTYTAEGLAEGDTLTGSLERAAGEDAGTYEITLGTLTAGDKYTIEFTGSTLTIEKKAVAVKADAKTKTYGDRDPELTYSAEGLVGNDTLTGLLARAEGENVGTYEITLGTLTAGDNYTLTFTGSTLTVEKKAVTVKADAKTKTYGGADPDLTYAVEGLVGSDTLTGSLARAEGENVGTYEITQGTLSASDNYTLTFTGAELTVKAKRISVMADEQKKAVGTSDPELTYIVEGLVGNDKLTGSLAREAGEDEGTYAITLGTLSAGDNYVINFTGSDFTIYENRVETDVNVGEGAPEMKIENIDGESASSLLTEEEKEALDNGEEVKIYLEVIAVDEEIVPEEDKNEIEKEAKKSGMTVGIYLDMSLLKQVGRNDAVAIHDTEGNMVKVTVTVPEELRNTNPNIKRTFYVVRVHEGKTDVLGESTGDTVSFETDKFSTYSLTYRDSDGTEAGSLTWLWIVIAIAAAAAVCAVWFFFIKKKEKTTK